MWQCFVLDINSSKLEDIKTNQKPLCFAVNLSDVAQHQRGDQRYGHVSIEAKDDSEFRFSFTLSRVYDVTDTLVTATPVEYVDTACATEYEATSVATQCFEEKCNIDVTTQTQPLDMVDAGFQIQAHVGHASTQTKRYELTESFVQATAELTDMVSQTHIRVLTDSFSQCEQKVLSDNSVQAMPTCVSKTQQTANKTECFAQQTDALSVKDTYQQTTRDGMTDMHVQAQADVADYCVQVLPAYSSHVVQATAEMVNVQNQTEVNHQDSCVQTCADQLDVCVQVEPEKSDDITQTVVDAQDVSMQVTPDSCSISLQTCQHESQNSETQTDLVWVSSLQLASTQPSDVDDSTATTCQVSTRIDEMPLLEKEESVPGSDSQSTALQTGDAIESEADTTTRKTDMPPEDSVCDSNIEGIPAKLDTLTPNEKMVQTDPVTIIIGDASFLVEKLKVYSEENHVEVTEETPIECHDEREVHSNADRSTETIKPAVSLSESHGKEASRKTTPKAAATLAPQVKSTPITPGSFNCPYCDFNAPDAVVLYSHLHKSHNCPTTSKRQGMYRSPNTIVMDDQGNATTAEVINKKLKLTQERQSLHANGAGINSWRKRLRPTDHRNQHDSAKKRIQITAKQHDVETAGKRAFTCQHCSKVFSKSSDLYIHLQNNHKYQRSQRSSINARTFSQPETSLSKTVKTPTGSRVQDEYDYGSHLQDLDVDQPVRHVSSSPSMNISAGETQQLSAPVSMPSVSSLPCSTVASSPDVVAGSSYLTSRKARTRGGGAHVMSRHVAVSNSSELQTQLPALPKSVAVQNMQIVTEGNGVQYAIPIAQQPLEANPSSAYQTVQITSGDNSSSLGLCDASNTVHTQPAVQQIAEGNTNVNAVETVYTAYPTQDLPTASFSVGGENVEQAPGTVSVEHIYEVDSMHSDPISGDPDPGFLQASGGQVIRESNKRTYVRQKATHLGRAQQNHPPAVAPQTTTTTVQDAQLFSIT